MNQPLSRTTPTGSVRKSPPSGVSALSPETAVLTPPQCSLQRADTTLHVSLTGTWLMAALTPQISAQIESTLSQAVQLLSVPHPASSLHPTPSPSAAGTGSTTPSSPAATPSITTLELHCPELGAWDTSIVVVVTRLVALAQAHGQHLVDDALPEGIRNLTTLALTVPPNTDARRSAHTRSVMDRLGDFVMSIPKTGGNILSFLGEVALSFSRLLRGNSACTLNNVWLCVQEAGWEALPIVSLISLLVGLILAFVGVIQLSLFGAEIYVSSLVAVGMTRIMGAIMTGIILAGRTGASYAAVIGTMQVNEEIDALSTLGVTPSDFLALPRILALTCMTPLLVLYSDFMGILGGFLVGVGVLGLDPMEYYTFTHKGFNLNNVWVGMAHGLVFGLVIAITGCYQGLRCGRSAQAVGVAVTSSVVYSIVGIVLATSLLTLLCNILKI